MNRLCTSDRARAVACLVEGNSIRSTARITGLSRKGVARLADDLGAACGRFMAHAMVNLPCRRIQCDEIWSFVGSKEKNTSTAAKRAGCGDAWTFVAIDPDTKLIPAWYVADRTAESAYRFMRDLQPRLANRVQLTTDGHRAYLVAVEAAWAFKPIDFAQVVKIYGSNEGAGRYSPAGFVGETITIISGNPAVDFISTSHAERQNLTCRMSMRRFTRLTNAFSKNIECHKMACALHFAHYNFCRIHSTIRVTPAMEAGLTDHVWSIATLIGLLEAEESLPLAA